jgi:hypothetical protein
MTQSRWRRGWKSQAKLSLRCHRLMPRSTGAGGLVFERRSSSGGRVVAAVLFFPLGLLALLGRRERGRIVISFEGRGASETNMTVHGAAFRRVRKAFAH